MLSLGIDLAGSKVRDSGYCVLGLKKDKKSIQLISIGILHDDKEIIKLADKYEPNIIAIDAPLSIPFGRENIDDKKGPHFRTCDIELRKRKIKFFPITLGPMRMLTKRGIRLKSILISKDYNTIEVFPGASYDIYGIERKNKDMIRNWIKQLTGKKRLKMMTQDELDAFTCAYTGLMYLRGKAETIGDIEEGLMVIPKKQKIKNKKR